jgi:hypothetical protein
VGPLDREASAWSGRWRLPDGSFLLRSAHTSWPSYTYDRIPLADGGEISSASPFVLVAPDGRVLERYSAPKAYSLEDTFYVYDVYVVTGDRLVDYMGAWPWRGDIRVDERVVLTGLVDWSTEALPFDLRQIPQS